MSYIYALFMPLALALSPADIFGDWHYDGFFFEGQRYPKPNPQLVLTFSFFKDGTHRLHWVRQNEGVTCERKGSWTLQSDRLLQKVTWINPANHQSCSQDPDMQLGRETSNQIQIRGDVLEIHMELNGKPFLYLLKRGSPSPNHK